MSYEEVLQKRQESILMELKFAINAMRDKYSYKQYKSETKKIIEGFIATGKILKGYCILLERKKDSWYYNSTLIITLQTIYSAKSTILKFESQ